MKFTLLAVATFPLAAGVQAQINTTAIQSQCTDTCEPFTTLYNDDCLADVLSSDEATAQKGVDCFCADSSSKKLLDCTGCLTNSTQGQGLIDTWNSACTTSYGGNHSALTYTKGTAVAASSAAAATETASQGSGAARQVALGGFALFLTGGLALLA